MPTKFTEEYVKNFINSDPDYEVVFINYINQKSKIRIHHKVCGCNFEMDFTHWKDRGQRCSICSLNLKKKSHEAFIEEITTKYPGKYTMLSNYVNKRTKIDIKCNICR